MGRTPWSARVPLDPPLANEINLTRSYLSLRAEHLDAALAYAAEVADDLRHFGDIADTVHREGLLGAKDPAAV